MPDETPFIPEASLNKSKSPIKVIIADDHAVPRKGIADLINATPGFEVCKEFPNGQQLLNWYTGTNADMILMDMRMPVLDGRETSKQLLSRFPDVKIIIFSFFSEPAEIRQVLNLGVRAWLTKNIEPDDFIQSILRVYNGEKIFPESVFINAIDGQAPTNENVPDALLGNRELEVLQLIAKGKNSKSIAAELNISELTVKTHRQNLMRKLGAGNVVTLVLNAAIKGYLK